MGEVDTSSVVKQWPTERKKLSDLTPAEYNPRVIQEDAFDGLKGSLNFFGMLVPIVWNKRSGRIVGGHQRYRALIEAGETESDVTVVDLDEDSEIRLNITLNNRGVRGEFTEEALSILEDCEQRLGESFKYLQMTSLQELLEKRKSQEKKKEKKEKREKKDGTLDGKDGSGDDDGGDNGDEGPDAVIICPACESRFRMKDNEVLENAAVED